MDTKNTALRNRLAKRLRELRTWAPARHWGLRRPALPTVVATIEGSLTYQALTAEIQAGLDWVEESARQEGTSPRWASPKEEGPLSNTRLKLEVREGVPALVASCAQIATDREYAEYLSRAWSRYLTDSAACDDTAARFQEYLRLRAIYEPQISLLAD